ncbi:MAG: outer membrane beta-barrel protein [Bacteroidota bacterium]|nr:outer membrane beta-barrel protein [Bacteroidota bacterium]MDP4237519.1 outer membrane beta-barrel protein [Bacteroidota bacterium]
MKKNNLIVGFALLLLLAAPLHGQILSRGDLFGPGAPPPMIGVELGLGSHQQNGTFQAICKCEFPAASGTAFLGGLLFELPVSYEWTFGLGVKVDFKGYSSSTTVNDTATVTNNATAEVGSGSFYFQRNGSIKETFLVFAPFVRYEFFRNGPFVQVGPGIDILISSNFTHTREITTSSIVLTGIPPDTGHFTIDNVRFQNGTRSETLESGKIANAATTRISALITGGWDIPVGDNAVLAPMITYDFPFTKVRDNSVGANGAQDWKITSLFFSVGLKYKLE